MNAEFMFRLALCSHGTGRKYTFFVCVFVPKNKCLLLFSLRMNRRRPGMRLVCRSPGRRYYLDAADAHASWSTSVSSAFSHPMSCLLRWFVLSHRTATPRGVVPPNRPCRSPYTGSGPCYHRLHIAAIHAPEMPRRVLWTHRVRPRTQCFFKAARSRISFKKYSINSIRKWFKTIVLQILCFHLLIHTNCSAILEIPFP